MNKFSGAIVAAVTPFKNQKLDEPAFAKLVKWWKKDGATGVVIGGTTGESATLNKEEIVTMVEIAREAAGKKFLIITGAGSNDTRKAVKLCELGASLKADAVLATTPYYNRPTQAGLVEHYKTLSKVGVPVILYNVPTRTGCDLLPETVAKIAQFKNIAGIKEASGNPVRALKIRQLVDRQDFAILSGEDNLVYFVLASGGVGVISASANLIPKVFADICNLWFGGKIDESRDVQMKYLPVVEALFFETNPIPVKTALALQGKIREEFRLPLVKMGDANKEKLKGVLKAFGLLD